MGSADEGDQKEERLASPELSAKVKRFASGRSGLAEKLALLIDEYAEQENFGCLCGVILVLLQHAPDTEVAEHRESLASCLAAAAEASAEEFAESSTALGGIAKNFVAWLTSPPPEEVQW